MFWGNDTGAGGAGGYGIYERAVVAGTKLLITVGAGGAGGTVPYPDDYNLNGLPGGNASITIKLTA